MDRSATATRHSGQRMPSPPRSTRTRPGSVGHRYLMIRQRGRSMRLLARLLEPKATAYAHCDLPCGVYDPAYQTRALIIKEQRSELVKHHLWVLWTDYFKPPHFERYPQLHTLFNEATKLAGAAGTKGSADVAKAEELLAKIEEINKIFWETKQG